MDPDEELSCGAMVYGLWAPGVEQAEALVANLTAPASVEYNESDLVLS